MQNHVFSSGHMLSFYIMTNVTWFNLIRALLDNTVIKDSSFASRIFVVSLAYIFVMLFQYGERSLIIIIVVCTLIRENWLPALIQRVCKNTCHVHYRQFKFGWLFVMGVLL